MREHVLAEIEPLRKDKQIGSSLQAQGRAVGGRRRSSALLERYADDLPMLFIVSEVELQAARRGDGRDGVARHDRARRRRQVRALLALRADGRRATRHGPGSASAARTRWPRPSMDDAIDAAMAAAPARRAGSNSGCRSLIVALDQVDQGAGAAQRCRCTTA